MKKFLVVAAIVSLAMVSQAWGFTAGTAYNEQTLSQNGAVTNFAGDGMDSSITQDASGYGWSAASPGGYGIENQNQGQGIHEGGFNPAGNAYHRYDVDMITEGGSSTGWGIASHSEAANSKGMITTQADGTGTATAAGSVSDTDAEVSSWAIGASVSGSQAGVAYNSQYAIVNNGASSSQVQVGVQKSLVVTESASALIGASNAGAETVQAGGGVMSNSGTALGTMKSQAGAATAVDTDANAWAISTAKSTASAMQVHEGAQAATWGSGTYQYQHYRVETGASETSAD